MTPPDETQDESAAAIQRLIRDLYHEDRWVRREAQFALETQGAAAVNPLMEVLHDGAVTQRRLAAHILGVIGDAHVVELLIRSLQEDDDRTVRASAASALARFQDPRGVTPLIVSLQDTAAQVRWEAATSLGRLKDPKAIDALIDRLAHDPFYLVRANAAASLGEFRDDRAVESLCHALHDTHFLVRGAAARSLGQIGGKDVVPILRDALEKENHIWVQRCLQDTLAMFAGEDPPTP